MQQIRYTRTENLRSERQETIQKEHRDQKKAEKKK